MDKHIVKAKSLDRRIKKQGIDDRLYFHRYRLSNAEYHSITQAVSSTALKELFYGKNPYLCHQKYIARTVENKQSDAMLIGAATHKLILEPRSFHKEFAVYEGRRAGGAWAAFQSAHQGKDIITATQFKEIKAMQRAVFEHPEARKLLSGGEAEKSVIWRDHDTGVLCRARADYQKVVNGNLILVDVKTCRSAEPEQFAKDLIKMGYPLQEAMYREGFQAQAFAFVAIEKETNIVMVYTLDDLFDECGNYIFRQAIEKWAEHLTNNEWLKYDRPGVSQLDCPEWWANKVLAYE